MTPRSLSLSLSLPKDTEPSRLELVIGALVGRRWCHFSAARALSLFLWLKIKVLLYIAFLRPIATFESLSLSSLAKFRLKNLEVFQNRILRAITKDGPIRDRVVSLAASVVAHLIELDPDSPPLRLGVRRVLSIADEWDAAASRYLVENTAITSGLLFNSSTTRARRAPYKT